MNILRIRGYFKHNQACREAGLARLPTRPLHPAVLDVALSQMKDGATLDAIQARNRELYTVRGYPGQPCNLMDSPYRWLTMLMLTPGLILSHPNTSPTSRRLYSTTVHVLPKMTALKYALPMVK